PQRTVWSVGLGPGGMATGAASVVVVSPGVLSFMGYDGPSVAVLPPRTFAGSPPAEFLPPGLSHHAHTEHRSKQPDLGRAPPRRPGSGEGRYAWFHPALGEERPLVGARYLGRPARSPGRRPCSDRPQDESPS